MPRALDELIFFKRATTTDESASPALTARTGGSMRFGIVSPATPDVPTHAATAESLGFETGWLFDSHMVYSDVYVIMALCAQRTQRMTFGPGIAVAPSR